MKEIKLTRGLIALVDDEDFEYLSQFKWQGMKGRKTFYAVRQVWRPEKKRSDVIYMHREILGLKHIFDFCDHTDHNGLNNQRNNLRKCTDSQNKYNTSSHKDGTSKYRGVDFYKRIGKWRVRINKDNVGYYFGYYKTEQEAAKVYNKEAIKLFGEFANLNQV